MFWKRKEKTEPEFDGQVNVMLTLGEDNSIHAEMTLPDARSKEEFADGIYRVSNLLFLLGEGQFRHRLLQAVGTAASRQGCERMGEEIFKALEQCQLRKQEAKLRSELEPLVCPLEVFNPTSAGLPND